MCLLFIAGGAIVNVAVAWGCSFLGSIDGAGPRDARELELGTWDRHRPAHMHSVPLFFNRATSTGADLKLVIGDQSGIAFVTTDDRGRVMSFGWGFDGSKAMPFDHALLARSGWPFHSLQGSRWHHETHQRPPAVSIRHVLTAAPTPDATTHVFSMTIGSAAAEGREPRLLPLGVIPAGFAVNTLLYAAIAWMLFAAPFAFRRAMRRHRRLCESCAYPIGVSPVCTECGAAVRPRPTPAGEPAVSVDSLAGHGDNAHASDRLRPE